MFFLYKTFFINCIMCMCSGPEAAYYQLNHSINLASVQLFPDTYRYWWNFKQLWYTTRACAWGMDNSHSPNYFKGDNWSYLV